MSGAVSKIVDPLSLFSGKKDSAPAAPVAAAPAAAAPAASLAAERKDKLRFAGSAAGIARADEEGTGLLGGTKRRSASRELLG